MKKSFYLIWNSFLKTYKTDNQNNDLNWFYVPGLCLFDLHLQFPLLHKTNQNQLQNFNIGNSFFFLYL